MPKRERLPREFRELIADDIRARLGRNEIARRRGVSAGSVTAIAREFRLHFDDDYRTLKATHAHQVDCWRDRVEKAEALMRERERSALVLLGDDAAATRGRARRERRLSYALYNLDRHHDGTYPTL